MPGWPRPLGGAETTIRWTLAWVDADLLAALIGAWLADRERPGQRRRAVAVDGKTLGGARCEGRQVHLLAVMDHTTCAVLAQFQSDGAPVTTADRHRSRLPPTSPRYPLAAGETCLAGVP
jgi:hypothetical protein